MAVVWLSKAVVLAIHQEQLAEHGGAPGIRDEGLLDSALARPRNRAAYEASTLAQLAAAYATGVAWDHPFVDGNKRVSLIVAELFLALNGLVVEATDAESVLVYRSLAEGTLSERDLANWIEEHCIPFEGG